MKESHFVNNIFGNFVFRILQGGVSAGLSHVVEDTTPKLYIVKGKRQPVVRQLPAISWDLMNDGDVFILDARDSDLIFVWVGRNSNRLERLQAAKLAQKIKEENGEGEIVHVEDGNEQATPAEQIAAFERHLALSAKAVKAAAEVESDDKEDIR